MGSFNSIREVVEQTTDSDSCPRAAFFIASVLTALCYVFVT